MSFTTPKTYLPFAAPNQPHLRFAFSENRAAFN